MNVYISFLSNLVLGNDIQVCETLVQESSHIVGLLQYLRVYIIIDERKQLFKYSLDVLDLIQI
jgi:hypothetical protein